MNTWFYLIEGKQYGPVTFEQLVALVAREELGKTSLVWRPGMTAWTPAANIAGLFSPPDIGAQKVHGADPVRPSAQARVRTLTRVNMLVMGTLLLGVAISAFHIIILLDFKASIFKYGFGNIPPEAARYFAVLSDNEAVRFATEYGYPLLLTTFWLVSLYMMLNTLRVVGLPYALHPNWSLVSTTVPLWNLYRPWAGLAEVHRTLDETIARRGRPSASVRGFHTPSAFLALAVMSYALGQRVLNLIAKAQDRKMTADPFFAAERLMDPYIFLTCLDIALSVAVLAAFYEYSKGFIARYRSTLTILEGGRQA